MIEQEAICFQQKKSHNAHKKGILIKVRKKSGKSQKMKGFFPDFCR